MRSRWKWLLSAMAGLGAALVPATCFAATSTPTVNSGDEAWILASSALVLLMTPGVAFFYGGLVRTKNVITTMLQVLAVILVVSVQWVVVGYSLAFGPDFHHIIGNLSWVMIHGVGAAPDSDYAPTIPKCSLASFK